MQDYIDYGAILLLDGDKLSCELADGDDYCLAHETSELNAHREVSEHNT
jgi:hypothetical protein